MNKDKLSIKHFIAGLFLITLLILGCFLFPWNI